MAAERFELYPGKVRNHGKKVQSHGVGTREGLARESKVTQRQLQACSGPITPHVATAASVARLGGEVKLQTISYP